MIDKLIAVSLLTFLIGIKNENNSFKLEKDIKEFDSFGSTIFRSNNFSFNSLIKETIDDSFLINEEKTKEKYKINEDNFKLSSLNSNDYKEDYLNDISLLESKESIDFSKLPSLINNEEDDSNYVIPSSYEFKEDYYNYNHEELYSYKEANFISSSVFDTLNNKNYSFIDNNPNKSIKNKLNKTDFSISFENFFK